MNDWVKKGELVQLRRGYYFINDDQHKQYSALIYASQIYKPSYISLEFALSYYGIIPEAVWTISSVSSRKTARFTNQLGCFDYKQLKPSLFFGFEKVKESESFFYIAKKEKAILDYIYLNSAKFKVSLDDFEALRWQNLDSLDFDLLDKYAQIFDSNKLFKILKILKKYSEQESEYIEL